MDTVSILPSADADLSCVHAAAGEMVPALTGHTAVVTKLPVLVGTGDEVACIPSEARPDANEAR